MAACHQPTDRETGSFISAESLLVLTTTARPAVACEVEQSQSVSSFRIEPPPFSVQGPLKQRSAMPSPCLGPDLHESA